jgi:hypothetical protein
MRTKNKYTTPVPGEMLQRIDRLSSPAHIGKLRNAVDFIVPIGTPVLAAADGIVTHINDDSNVGGPDVSYWFYTNFITIKHSNGEYSRYDHLDYKSSKVRLNQKVQAGSDSQCQNQHEREDRFLDRYEEDPENNGKLQSFISSFKNTEPC